MVVGPSGRNADRVVAALEQARIKVVRVGSAPVACEKLGNTMPQVVILIALPEVPHRIELADRAEAVGAVVMGVDERLEGDEYEDVVNDVITTAITRKMARDDTGPSSHSRHDSEAPEVLDDDDIEEDVEEDRSSSPTAAPTAAIAEESDVSPIPTAKAPDEDLDGGWE